MTARPLAGASCLVLGGGGFIGVNLSRALVDAGARVEAFGRHLPFPEALQGVTWTGGSFADREALARAVDGNEYVFHLIGGGTPESSNKDPAADLLSSVLNTIPLLDLCLSSHVKKIVFASSGGTVYGTPACTPIPESAPTDPVSAYGISKLAVEKYLGLYRHLHALDSVSLRVSNAYGPFQTADRKQGVIAAMVRRALAGDPVEIWGSGDVVRDFIHVDDVVAAMLASATYQGAHRVFNVGSGEGRSVNQILSDVEAVVGRGLLNRIYRPGRPADVPVNVLDAGLIGREMGWRPRVDWLSGLRGTVDWLESRLLTSRDVDPDSR
jgi:UDP-glucose 4-epimerase